MVDGIDHPGLSSDCRCRERQPQRREATASRAIPCDADTHSLQFREWQGSQSKEHTMPVPADARSKLEAEHDRIRAEIVEVASRPATFLASVDSYYGNHLADTATDMFEEEKALALEAHLTGLLAKIDAALERIEHGTYGICEKCGQPIAPERLEALRYASTCLVCSSATQKTGTVGRH
jgi:RNA polymerase-binding transcription factor DksA